MKSYICRVVAGLFLIVVLSVLGLFLGNHTASAQESERRIQILTGQTSSDNRSVYTLPELNAGETLYVRVENLSGNLDPIALLLDKDTDLEAFSDAALLELNQAISDGRDPLMALPEVYDQYTLVWNDDYYDDSTAAFEVVIPADAPKSTFQLIVAGALGTDNFGKYKLLIGLNAPEVLNGAGVTTGAPIAFLDPTQTEGETSVKAVIGTITDEEPQATFILRDLISGDTIYAFVEATSGNLAPILVLRNFNDKPLRSGNASGQESSANLQYTLERDVKNFKIGVESFVRDAVPTTGEYRILIGVNSPEVLSGKAEPGGRSPLVEPIEVRIGANLQQITGIDQQAEKFGVVAQLRLEWQDPALAFNPDTCQCNFIAYTGDSFSKFADENEILWPEFTLFNQQGNRWVQNRNVGVYPDGRAVYQERFTTDFQAPLFNFVRFPFDQQKLYIQAVSIGSTQYFSYTNPTELSIIGDQLGEEEWFIVGSESEITIEDEHASYWLYFDIVRHLNFYVYRIFVPIGLVILVSWLTFWLKDYGKRVDVSSANLLLFVAYNFTIAGELPRLGYLTFMDAVLIGAFVVSIFVVLFNVILRRLENEGRVELAHRIDRPMIWLYPLLYVFGALIAVWQFLL
jgi:hypothetical protein